MKKKKKGHGDVNFLLKIYSSLNPNDFWLDQEGKVRCLMKIKVMKRNINLSIQV